MKKTRHLPDPPESQPYMPLVEDEEAAALFEMAEDGYLSDEEGTEDSHFFIPPTSKHKNFFHPSISEYDDIHEPSFGDAIKIRHNFVMLMHLMAEESEKPKTEQRFRDLSEDKNTHLNNKRIDFQLKSADGHFYPAYCYRHQKKIVYGLPEEIMTNIKIRTAALSALIQLAQADIATLTHTIKKPQPPFEVDTHFKEPAFIQEIQTLLDLPLVDHLRR